MARINPSPPRAARRLNPWDLYVELRSRARRPAPEGLLSVLFFGAIIAATFLI